MEVGHSPDPDDAFMFYALAKGRLETGSFQFRHVLRDIETLNRWAMEGRLPVTAISLHAYAHVADRYALLPHGASIGDRYGPIVVAREALSPEALRGVRIAVPGTLTTAFLALTVCLGRFQHAVIPFDRILDAVHQGEYAAGLIIHEGQLTYSQLGLTKVLDLGEWWHGETGLPLPLGVNAIRKDLGSAKMTRVSALLRESITYALTHREEALSYAMAFARNIDRPSADTFVGMYVNDFTLNYGEVGREAVGQLLSRGHAEGLLPRIITPEFVEDR
ncbi:MAG: MqnA/MqnD/SBP family protein [Candidatus Methylomirabilales bacterium]